MRNHPPLYELCREPAMLDAPRPLGIGIMVAEGLALAGFFGAIYGLAVFCRAMGWA